jgi:hypothetical protein
MLNTSQEVLRSIYAPYREEVAQEWRRMWKFTIALFAEQKVIQLEH